jgi:hypothetical protein
MYANSEANPNAFNGLDPDRDSISASPKPTSDPAAAGAASAANHDRCGTQRAHLHAASAALSALGASANSGAAAAGSPSADAVSAALELIRLHGAVADQHQHQSPQSERSNDIASPREQPQSPAPQAPQPPTLFPGKTAYTSLYMLYNLSAVHSIPMLLSWLTNAQLTTLSKASPRLPAS